MTTTPDKGASLLHDAARKRDGYAVQQLCLAGADVESPSGHASNTPLITAASHGSLVTVDLLLASGADPREANKLGTTALAAACRRLVPVPVDALSFSLHTTQAGSTTMAA